MISERIKKRWRALFRKDELESELDAELRFHLERDVAQNLQNGMNPEDAHYAALKSFGRLEQSKEECRDARGVRLLEEFWQDLRYGVRTLRKHRGFALTAIFTLALGIGANTAVFSLINALLLRPLPYAEPERLVLLAEKSREGERLKVSYPNFADWRARAQSFEGMAATATQAFNLRGVDKSGRAPGRTVNWNFFQLLGINPQLGRLFTAADDRYGAAGTVIVSHRFWQGHLGGEANVIGKVLQLTGEPHTVIGVLPPGFEYFAAADVYVPLELSLAPKSGLADRGSSFGGMHAVARLKPGVTLEQANTEMAALGAQLAQEYPKVNEGKSAQVERLQDRMSETVRQSLWVLLAAVGFILLIACINVANLMMVRAADRQKEIAVRLALGASRWRIVRQLLSESLLIAVLGGACGLLIGHWMLSGLLTLAPQDIPHLSRVRLDKTVLLFTLGIAAVTSFLFGLLPALQASKAELQTAVKEGGRLTTGAAREGMRKGLLIAEVSLSLVLLVGAGLLVRSMYNLLHVDLGFNADNLLTMRMSLQGGNYNPGTARVFYDECLARVSALPGVRSAALTMSLPIEGAYWDSFFTAADKPTPSRADLPESDYVPVSANYFETMGIRLMQGRWFTAADTPESKPVVVINETLARRIWPGENPIGKRVKQGYPEGDAPWREVIGVVNDIKLNGVDRATSMQTYLSFAQEPKTSLAVVVRTNGNPSAAAASVQQAIHSIDKDLPVYLVLTMDQLLGNSLAQRRLTLVLLASFAALALVMAAIGVYGVISYAVRQRTHELGIRMALGATARDVLKLILSQGLRLALVGVAIGLLVAFALTRWMESLLFGVRPTDPLTFAMIASVLLTVSLLACWIPARRAMKVDPMISLRCD